MKLMRLEVRDGDDRNWHVWGTTTSAPRLARMLFAAKQTTTVTAWRVIDAKKGRIVDSWEMEGPPLLTRQRAEAIGLTEGFYAWDPDSGTWVPLSSEPPVGKSDD